MTQLSILIPSIPSRFERAKSLYEKIDFLVGDKDIEILMLTDNKKRTIGEKREALKNASNGKYFMFVDDDDDLLEIEDVYNATFEDVDVITFKQLCLNADKTTFTVTFGLGNEIEHTSHNGRYLDCKRPPFHICAWNQRFKDYEYPCVNYAEDWGWLQKVLPLAKTEKHIPKIVHSYNFDPKISEASTDSNIVWQNPNKQQPITLSKRNKKYRMVTKTGKTRAIVNLVNGNGNYLNAQIRLEHSAYNNADKSFDFICFQNESQVNAPPHHDNPYAFKIYAIEKLREMGYTEIFWMDASLVMVADFSPIWEWIWQKGFFFEEAGHWAGSWCNQDTLNYFGITKEQAMTMPMFAAGYCGFDFKNAKAQEFFAEWKESMLNGCFRGSWTDHRHDMTCASIIAHKHDMVKDYSSGGQFFAYIGEVYGTPLPTVVAHLVGR
jgi:hypothetical protein